MVVSQGQKASTYFLQRLKGEGRRGEQLRQLGSTFHVSTVFSLPFSRLHSVVSVPEQPSFGAPWRLHATCCCCWCCCCWCCCCCCCFRCNKLCVSGEPFPGRRRPLSHPECSGKGCLRIFKFDSGSLRAVDLSRIVSCINQTFAVMRAARIQILSLHSQPLIIYAFLGARAVHQDYLDLT